MIYSKKIASLKEKALCKVAINLSQDNIFKEVAMCLEKPTYGTFVSTKKYESPLFICDPSILSLMDTLKGDQLASVRNSLRYRKLILWNAAVEEQCERLIKGFPISLKQELNACIHKLALEYLNYCRQQELLFGVSRYFLMDILNQNDWTEAGRLNEMKIAKRLVTDERLTVLQRYYIACVYCFHVNVSGLWNNLTQKEKRSAIGNKRKNASLISLWSNYMRVYQDKELSCMNKCWEEFVQVAICYGNETAVAYFWKKIDQNHQRQIIIDMTLLASMKWSIAQTNDSWREKLVVPKKCYSHSDVPDLNLPYCYSELVHFFLSEMSEKEILTFFEEAFKKEGNEEKALKYMNTKICILDCFLEWPLHDYFLPTMNFLWDTIPMSKYGQFLLSLAYRYCVKGSYSSFIHKIIPSCDYGSVLLDLWKNTPEDYKQYIFYDNRKGSDNYGTTMIKNVLFQLLKKNLFEEKDVTLFKQIWLDLPQEIRKAMMEIREPQMRFSYGDDICWVLLEKKMWSFASWLLEKHFPLGEIPNYKKRLIETRHFHCFYELRSNNFKFVEDLINWCLESETEKSEFKYKLFTDQDSGLDFCSFKLRNGHFSTVDKIIDFCILSDETKEYIKIECAEDACRFLLMDCKWKLMDRILKWCYAKGGEIGNSKQTLFFIYGTSFHYTLIFYERKWEELENFYKWFSLSSEEIKQIKNKAMFMPETIENVHKALYENISMIEMCLRCCLTDEEALMNFKAEIEKKHFNKITSDEDDKRAQKCLEYIINELLDDLRKDQHDTTNRVDVSMKDKERKRSLMIEDECSLAKHLKFKK